MEKRMLKLKEWEAWSTFTWKSWYANKLKVKIEVFDNEKLLIGFDSKLWEPNL